MADDGRILWERSEGCLCGAELHGAELNNGTEGRLRLLREVRLECPLHGDRSDVVEEALAAAESILESVPGVPRIARPQLRRLIMAALPVLARAIAEGRLPTLPPPSRQEPEPGGDPAASSAESGA